jgi:hypothetical protein
MAFSGTLHIEGHPKEQDGLKVISCDFAFDQKIDEQGMAISKISGGVINIGLKNENDYDIIQWMFFRVAKKNGKIVFSSGTQDNQSFQTVKFKDAVLFSYHQSYSEEDEITVNISLSCREIEISGASFTNIWDFYEGS